jgi:hypothetical protein
MGSLQTTRFKVGDKVKFTRVIISEDEPYFGKTLTVSKVLADNYYALKGCSTDMKGSQLERVGKAGKLKPVRFLLQYELEEDPIEEFSTMEEVNARIKELVEEEEDLKRDSMVVYEIKSKKQVKVETKISIK